METPDEKAKLINELEIKITALIEERQEVHKKCDMEPDPKQRAVYWTKIAMLDDAIHRLRNDLFSRKVN